MEGLGLTVTTSSTTSSSSCCSSSSSSSYSFLSCFRNPICSRLRMNSLSFSKRNTSFKFVVLASKDDPPKLDPMDLMELKFGRLLGEEPKLTMAKIMARKANPDVTYLEVEKSYYKNKGKIADMKEIPIDWSKDGQSPSPLDGVNLVRPVPKKGFEYKSEIAKPNLPVIKRPSPPVESVKRSVPNVILRKPSMANEPDVEDKPSRVRLRRNLSLSMRNQPAKEEFSDMTLLRKPEKIDVDESSDSKEERELEINNDYTLLNKLDEFSQDELSFELIGNTNAITNGNDESKDSLLMGKPTRLQPDESPSVISSNKDWTPEKELPNPSPIVSNTKSLVEAALIGKPKRLDLPARKVGPLATKVYPIKYERVADFDNLQVSSSVMGHEDIDWESAETLLKTGGRGEVELISCSTRGFAATFGSLVGFLPYRNLSSKWKFLAFESWLRRKGLNPALYRQNLGIIGNYEGANNSYALDSIVESNIDVNSGRELSADMKVEELLKIYDQEKIKFLTSFVGQKLKVNVLLVNRKYGKLLFSVKPKEKEEFVERKRSLMANLQVGDVVKCCITKITYFGIFVEVDGVPALIHQSEVSWDATLDPLAIFKVGQVVEAKVHQLDFTLDRIFLSLKEIMPDPLIEALESVVGDRDPLDARLQAAEADAEWVDVESLIKLLQQIEGIQYVSKGRFFLSPGLAPTFQVYMASMFENQYKLLARSGNKVQEVIVETSLEKEKLKSAILTCTNRVE